MNAGYYLLDAGGLDLTEDDAQSISGCWARAKEALATQKPIFSYNMAYGTGKPVSPVPCFGWYISTTEIVIVGATLHIHVKNDNTCTVLDVVPST